MEKKINEKLKDATTLDEAFIKEMLKFWEDQNKFNKCQRQINKWQEIQNWLLLGAIIVNFIVLIVLYVLR